MRNKKTFALGLMSGTSVDSIDASLIRIGDKQDTFVLHTDFAYPKLLKRELLDLIHAQEGDFYSLAKAHYEVGKTFALAAQKALKRARDKKILTKNDLVIIGSHGQTIFHDPIEKRTTQIGEPSFLTQDTGYTTVSDFRTADTVAGGDGAPLLPLYHRRLFSKPGHAVHNLGGISNFTYIGNKEIFALDTGPANCLMDLALQELHAHSKAFDRDGKIARSGSIHPRLLNELMNDQEILAFRRKKAPKSTGRELFSKDFLVRSLKRVVQVDFADLIRTLAEFTVVLAVESYQKEVLKKNRPLKEIIFTGGGSKNSFLLELFSQKINARIKTMEDYDLNSQSIESQAFAYFAWCCLNSKPISLASTTGVKKEIVCGKISPGKNWELLLKSL
ncbi:MAG: anhydro-N-acetylmuramic acid kinase [Oligoflexia bacterium]|nr:anhydro-N-acetylmuramic acid kinase [Oligoflexia bacterium]